MPRASLRTFTPSPVNLAFDHEAYTFLMPKGAPDAIVRRRNAAANETMNSPSVKQRLQAISATLVSPERRSPEYLRKFVADEVERWVLPIRAACISLE
jgi:tripartite-type tricarboxylate transporter receptor subunit TctC